MCGGGSENGRGKSRFFVIGEERREYLEARGIYCGIMEKAKSMPWRYAVESKVWWAEEKSVSTLPPMACRHDVLANAMNLKKMVKLVPA
ncbi:MAG: hypothetical protein ACUZ77_08090 [Candidatus Brocadiales bacterium]